MRKYLKFIIWLFLVFIFGFLWSFYWTHQTPKIEYRTVTQTVQLPAPKTYLCNASRDDVDLSSCWEISYTEANTYCFDDNCAYIYTDKELK